MGDTAAVRSGIIVTAAHPKVGLYWNFLRFTFSVDGAPAALDWNCESFTAVAAGRHELTVVGKPITRVGPSRANAALAVEVAPNEVVWVHYRGPTFALAFLGRIPLFRASLSVTRRAHAVSRRRPDVASSVEEIDKQPG
jgi:hypothetical protein